MGRGHGADVSPKVAECRHAGRCLCDNKGQRTRLLAKSFGLMLGKKLEKGSDLRESYVKANLVCRIQSTGTDIWFHLSFLNFSTRRGTMLRLQPIVDGPRHMLAAASGRIALSADMPELRLDTLWDLFDDPNLATVWSCEFLELASTDRVVDDGFLPGDVLAEAMQPPQCCVFWRPGVRRQRRRRSLHDGLAGGPPGGRQPSSRRFGGVRRPRTPLGFEEACPDSGSASEEGHGVTDTDFAQLAIEDMEDHDGVDLQEELGDILMGAMAMLEGVEEEDEGQSDDDNCALFGEGPMQDDAGILDPPAPPTPPAHAPEDGCFEMPVTVAPEEAPAAAIVAAAAAAPAATAAPRAPLVMRAPRGDSWARWPVPGLDGAWLVWDENRRSMGAHCSAPGHHMCRLNRVVKKRPVAFLICWLRAGGDHADRISHLQAARTGSLGSDVVSLERRQATRNWLRNQATLEGALQLEDPAEAGEPEEPVRVYV